MLIQFNILSLYHILVNEVSEYTYTTYLILSGNLLNVKTQKVNFQYHQSSTYYIFHVHISHAFCECIYLTHYLNVVLDSHSSSCLFQGDGLLCTMSCNNAITSSLPRFYMH